MTQDMVKMMSQDKMIGKREILSSSPSPWFSRFLRTMLLFLMMMGVGEMWGQEPVTITTDVNNKVLYLIQSFSNEAFYMRNDTRSASKKNLNTSNIVTTNSEFYFLDAGIIDETQYYYIVHNGTSKYVHVASAASGQALIYDNAPAANAAETTKDLYRFKIIKNNSRDAYNIIAKNSDLSLLKKDGNWLLTVIELNTADDDKSCWNFIEKTHFSKPAAPFSPSSLNGAKHKYYIQNNKHTTFYLIPGTTYVTTDTQTADNKANMMWYFVKAPASETDPYMDYYYIIHAQTGKYLRYRQAANTEASNQAVELSDYDSSENDRFLYIIVRGSVLDETSTTYCIAPYLPRVQRVENTISLCKKKDSNDGGGAGYSEAGVFKERNDNNFTHWNFISATLGCEAPEVGYADDGKIQVTCETDNVTIWYTTDESDPTDETNENRQQYNETDKIEVTETMTVVKAYAVDANSVLDPSDVTTFNLTIDDPVISYDAEHNKAVITCPNTPGANILYTMGDGEPTLPYPSGGVPLAIGDKTIKAIAKKGGVSTTTSDPYTIPFQTTVGEEEENERPYIIQSKNCKFYNLIPNVSVDDNTKYVNTLNVPSSTMAWFFKYAEKDYYYIVDANGWYMYYTSNTDKYIFLKSSKDDTDGFRFSITTHTNGGFSIIPKGQTNPIYKTNSDSDPALKPVMYDGTLGEGVARWDIIPYSTTNLPMWETSPFDVSTDDVTYYYTITPLSKNTDSDRRPLIINSSGDVNSEVVTAGLDERKTMWVIKKVGAYDETANPTGDNSELLDYYTIQNAYTGELIYYNGNGDGDGRFQQTPTFQMGEPSVTGANETWSHFVIVQTASKYNIIPRIFVDNVKAINRTSTPHYGFNCLNRSKGQDILGTFFDDGPGSRWTFDLQENVKCLEPVFTETDNVITLSCITNASEIFFTNNGEDPTAVGVTPTKYTNQTWSSSEQVRIKAYAKLISDNTSPYTSASDVVTLLNNPDITVGGVTYNGIAQEPDVTVSIGDTGDETVALSTAYSASYGGDNVNAGINAATVILTDADETDFWYIWNASTTYFSIDKAPLIITPTADQSKVYGDNDPTLTYSSSITTTSGLYGTDAFAGALGRAEGENVGSYAINQGTLKVTRESTDVSTNYDITIADESFAITARPITISGITASEKTYDGNATATLVFTGVTFGNIVDGDELTVTATGSFGDKIAATGKTVTISGLTLGGTSVGNYILAASGQQDEATADINPKPLTITDVDFTANNKIYDGTTDAVFENIDYSHATIEGIVDGDGPLTIVSATGAFEDKNVGTNKIVIISGFTFGGNDKDNYTYNGGNLTAKANITRASATVTAENKTKGYGDADPEFTWTVDGLKGADTKDVLTVSTSRTEGEDVGTIVTITPSGDAEQGNYNVSYETGTLTITAKAIGDGTTPAEGIDIDITYDGTNYTVTVKQGVNELQQGTDKDYTCTLPEGTPDPYVVTITGQGNYTNSAQATYIKQTFYDTTPDQVLTTETTVAVYCSTQNLKVNDTFEAYYVTKLENNTLTITKVEAGEGENKKNYIPEGQPVLLISETNPAPMGFTLKPYTGTGTDLVTIPETGEGANLLKVVTAEGGREVNLAEVYMFSMGEFVLTKAGTMSKGKFYLENPNYNTTAHSRSILSITGEDVTGINTSQLLDTDSQIPDIWYTIGGQKLHKKPTRKGLYLQNGKKVVIK